MYIYGIMVFVFFGYVTYLWAKYGILPSISDSWYELPDNKKWMFTIFCWGFSVPALILGLSLSNDNPFQFLIFLGASGIMFVGASPDFKKKDGLDHKVHRIGALTGVIANTLFLFFVFPQLWVVPTMFTILTTILFIKKQSVKEIWWIEVLSFLTYSTVIGIQLYVSLV